VLIHEVVLAHNATSLHFDVEIKELKHRDILNELVFIVRDHFRAEFLPEGVIVDKQFHIALKNAYGTTAVKPFMEEECLAGFNVVTKYMNDFVKESLGINNCRDIRL
jgi:hypothetical protein